MFSFMLS